MLASSTRPAAAVRTSSPRTQRAVAAAAKPQTSNESGAKSGDGAQLSDRIAGGNYSVKGSFRARVTKPVRKALARDTLGPGAHPFAENCVRALVCRNDPICIALVARSGTFAANCDSQDANVLSHSKGRHLRGLVRSSMRTRPLKIGTRPSVKSVVPYLRGCACGVDRTGLKSRLRHDMPGA